MKMLNLSRNIFSSLSFLQYFPIDSEFSEGNVGKRLIFFDCRIRETSSRLISEILGWTRLLGTAVNQGLVRRLARSLHDRSHGTIRNSTVCQRDLSNIANGRDSRQLPFPWRLIPNDEQSQSVFEYEFVRSGEKRAKRGRQASRPETEVGGLWPPAGCTREQRVQSLQCTS